MRREDKLLVGFCKCTQCSGIAFGLHRTRGPPSTGGRAQRLSYKKCDLKANISHFYTEEYASPCEVQGRSEASTYLKGKYVTSFKIPQSLGVIEKESYCVELKYSPKSISLTMAREEKTSLP